MNKQRSDVLMFAAGTLVGRLLPGSISEWREHLTQEDKRPWLLGGCWIVAIILALLYVNSREG